MLLLLVKEELKFEDERNFTERQAILGSDPDFKTKSRF